MPDETRVPLNRIERVLAVMIAGILVLSVITIVVVTWLNATGAAPEGPIWQSVQALPLVGLPIALLLLIVFLVLSTVRRRRIAEGGD